MVIKGAAIITFLISSYVVLLFSQPRLLFHHDCEKINLLDLKQIDPGLDLLALSLNSFGAH